MKPTLFNPMTTRAAHLPGATNFSPLVLADRLISLAQDADRAGLHDSASRLIGLAYTVLDDDSAAVAA